MVWNLLEKRIMENNENVTEPTPPPPPPNKWISIKVLYLKNRISIKTNNKSINSCS